MHLKLYFIKRYAFFFSALILSSKLTAILHVAMFIINGKSIPKGANVMGSVKPSEKFPDKGNYKEYLK